MQEKRAPKELASKKVAPDRAGFGRSSAAQLDAMAQRAQADGPLSQMFGFATAFLEASEYEIIEMMVQSKVWIGPVPPCLGDSGSAEFGLFAYWLNNPGDDPLLKDLAGLWKAFVGPAPATQIDADNYAALMDAVESGHSGLVAASGVWANESALNLDWAEAAVEYLRKRQTAASLGQNQHRMLATDVGSSRRKIALVRDWETSNDSDGAPASPIHETIQ